MISKKIVLISSLLLLSIFISACSSSVYASTSWHGLTADANYAYLAAGTQVYGVDLNTGLQKWKFPAKPNAKGFYANPVLTEDGQLLVPSYDHKLYKIDPNNLDPTSGSPTSKWSSPPDLKNRLIASPLVIGNTIYQPSSDGNLYLVNLTTGVITTIINISSDPLWAQPVEGVNCGCIYIASMDHRVYSIDLATNTKSQNWIITDLGGSIVGKPAIGTDGTLYVGTFGSQLFALDGTTGNTTAVVSTKDWVWAGPSLDNNTLYFGDLAGNFYAVKASDLTPEWEIKPNNSIVDTPVISGTNIYLTTEADSLYTISTGGTIENTAVVGGIIYTSALIAGDKILVAPTGFGSTLLVALSLESPSGSQKWAFTPAK
jgi:outer membrane protein assembly factor BamB